MLHDRKENSQNELDRATRDGETEPSAPDPTAGRSDAGANEVARHGALSARARYELVQECEALVVHVARHGDILNERDGLEEAYGRLLHRLGECGGDIPDSSADWPALVEAYAGVTRHTRAARGVSGRSVLDTWNAHGPEPRKWWSGRRWLALLLRPRRCGGRVR